MGFLQFHQILTSIEMDNHIVNILLIEDEDSHAELVCRSFEKLADRFRLATVDNLEKAKTFLITSNPDLIISDMLLPDGKGMDLLEQNDGIPRFPMIVMTSYGDEEIAVQAIKLGALDYVVKSAATFSDMPRIAERALREWNHIINRKRAEEQIKTSLKEKETLLQEIHHRVKNNMAVIASLLKLQENKVDDIRIKEALKQSRNRVYSMSAVHETLYRSNNLSEIEVEPFIGRILKFVLQTYQISPNPVGLTTEFDTIKLNIDQASPLGLVINELVSNALKFAFPDGRDGEITVTIKKMEKAEVEVTVKDNGIGMPENPEWNEPQGLGLQLVKTLIEDQLEGTLNLESNGGAKFVIRFNTENT